MFPGANLVSLGGAGDCPSVSASACRPLVPWMRRALWDPPPPVRMCKTRVTAHGVSAERDCVQTSIWETYGRLSFFSGFMDQPLCCCLPVE